MTDAACPFILGRSPRNLLTQIKHDISLLFRGFRMRPPGTTLSDGFAYFDHDADIGVIGRGATLEAAFEAAARGTFAIMADPERVRPREQVAFEFEEADVELALVRWLNLLITHAREQGLALGRFEIRRNGARWRGVAGGEPWPAGLERGVEVKGATLTMLRVTQDAAGWEARCVVDV
jgi:SHS2 domain-containing protein